MFDYQQKKNIRKILYSKVTLIVLLIFIFVLIKANYGIYQKEEMSRESLNIVKKDYNSLINRKTILDSEIKRMKTDDGVEEEIRSKFDVSKPGEVVVNIVDDENNNKKDFIEPIGFWQKIFNFFK